MVPAGSWAGAEAQANRIADRMASRVVNSSLGALGLCFVWRIYVDYPPGFVCKVFERKALGPDLGFSLSAEARPDVAGLQRSSLS